MSESIDFFFELPLWISIPFVTAYLALMAYVIHIFWHYRRRQEGR
jgi:hypothetical protein